MKTFYQPYINDSTDLRIFLFNKNNKTCVEAKTSDGKKYPLRSVFKKQLIQSYQNSKFTRTSIVVFAFHKYDNVKKKDHLYLYDILLEEDFVSGFSNQPYATRYDNLVLRFVSMKCNDISVLMSCDSSDPAKVNMFINTMLKNFSIEKAFVRKNSQYTANEQIEVIDVCSQHEAEMTSAVSDIAKVPVKDFDEKNPEYVDEECLTCILCLDEYNNWIALDLNMDVGSKIKAMKEIDEHTHCSYVHYKIGEYEGNTFLDFK